MSCRVALVKRSLCVFLVKGRFFWGIWVCYKRSEGNGAVKLRIFLGSLDR